METLKYYFSEKVEEKDHHKITTLIKSALKESMPGTDEDPIFSLAHSGENTFFLKGEQGVFWGYVFFNDVEMEHLAPFVQEMQRVADSFRQKIQPCLLFPGLKIESSELFRVVESALIFEYQWAGSRFGHALMLNQWDKGILPVSTTEAPKEAVRPPSEKPKPTDRYPFYERARLSREELSEIIDITFGEC